MKNVLVYLMVLFSLSISYGQGIFTKGEVYDFEIGDEFHYRYSAAGAYSITPDSAQVIRVLNKYTNTSYLYYEWGNISRSNPSHIISTYLDSIPLASLNDLVMDTTSNWIHGDTILTQDTIIIDSSLCHGPDSILSLAFTYNVPDNYEPASWIHRFQKGSGEISKHITHPNGSQAKFLVFSSKNGVNCGNSVYLTSVTTIHNQGQLFKISPNPFNNQLQLTINNLSSPSFNFELLNNLGQIVLKKTISKTTNINIPISESLPNGVYYAIIRQDKQQQIIKLIKAE